ncbi:hypothetical protein P9D43_20930 [Neobacillus niacini]|nr:hypothetical protein [Neobacillus niacini]MEC1524471.1 hypothetical protein [Neobacillus niacini]
MNVDELIKKFVRTKAEAEGIEKMISMMMCLKKYENLARFKDEKSNTRST